MEKALQTMINNMPEKTGRSFTEWKSILKEQKFEKHSQAVNYLKKEHGVTHGFANTIVKLSQEEEHTPQDLVANQYKGKEDLMPIYKALISYVTSLGEDVKVITKKTSVSVVRKRQFTLIKPATKTRIDLGLKLKGKATTERLENSGPFGTMCTHRVKISNTHQIDEELKGWLQEAYSEAL